MFQPLHNCYLQLINFKVNSGSRVGVQHMKLRNAAKSMLYKSLYFLLIGGIFVSCFFLLSGRFSSAFIKYTFTQCFQAKSIIHIPEMQTNILLYTKSGYFPFSIHITCLSLFAEEQSPATESRDYQFRTDIKHLKEFMQVKGLFMHKLLKIVLPYLKPC